MQPLTKDEIHAYLDSKPGWIMLTTIGRDGVPHTIPIGYFRSGDDVNIGGRAGTQKMKNIERNPNVTVLLQSGTSMQDIKGVMIQGTASVITEPAEFLAPQPRSGKVARHARRPVADRSPPRRRLHPRHAKEVHLLGLQQAVVECRRCGAS